MKFFHLSDLHIGKQLHGFSLLEDQKYILKQILEMVHERKPDVILLAGDIYDKSIPSGEAVTLVDDFLTGLFAMEDGPVVCMISGNHDSQERISYGSRLFAEHKIHIAGCAPNREEPEIRKVKIQDRYGDVTIWLLPFFRPSFLREIPGMEEVKSYEEAMKQLLEKSKPDFSGRNILLCHQFFTGNGKEPERSDSETVHVGGQDNIDASVVAAFDYVAAGHIHRPQSVGERHIRYCGSPLKYSISEAGWDKSVTEAVIGEKGELTIEALPLRPLHDVRKIQGTLQVLTAPETLAEADPEDYVSVTLTDEEELYEPGVALAQAYPNLLEWHVENSRTKMEMQEPVIREEKKSILELFGDFYVQMRGTGMCREQEELMREVMKALGGERN